MIEPQNNQNLDITYLRVEALKPYQKNARTHSNKQVKQIADSMAEFGFTNPILIDDHNMVIAGHGRLEAAKLLGLNEVPCVCLSSMSEAQKRAYIIADNKLALNAGWDEDLLAEELGALLDEDINFDIETTGFNLGEVDKLIADSGPEEPGDPDDDIIPDNDGVRRCKSGDIWQLGDHRLICGDARDPDTVKALMAGQKARMVFTDPPYNVPIDGHVSGLGKTQHREFAFASGEMSSNQFTRFLGDALGNLAKFSMDGSIHYICMDWRHMRELQDAADPIYTELKNVIVWAKDNGGMGTFYRSRHELIFAYKHGTEAHINTFELGQHGRYRTNVWEYKGANSMRAGRLEELAMHPTVKPVQMIADAIRDVSGRGDIVLDTFGGSGSTLIAAHKTGRRGYLCEFDPLYCDCIIARYEAYAHDEAERLACGIADDSQTEPNPTMTAEAAE